jgi:hypothetical protein
MPMMGLSFEADTACPTTTHRARTTHSRPPAEVRGPKVVEHTPWQAPCERRTHRGCIDPRKRLGPRVKVEPEAGAATGKHLSSPRGRAPRALSLRLLLSLLLLVTTVIHLDDAGVHTDSSCASAGPPASQRNVVPSRDSFICSPTKHPSRELGLALDGSCCCRRSAARSGQQRPAPAAGT